MYQVPKLPLGAVSAVFTGGSELAEIGKDDDTTAAAVAGLKINFDSPMLVRPADATVAARSSSAASDIYALAVTQAQPAGAVASPAWQRVSGEIQAAQAAYGQPGGDKPIVCSPDDWAVPDHGVHGRLGSPQAGRPVMLAGAPAAAAAIAPAVVSPVPMVSVRDLGMLPPNLDFTAVLSQAPTVPDVTSSTTSLVLHLEHTCVSLSRALGGQSWWNGVFLADQGWYVPGMPGGTLVPAAPPPVTAPDGTAQEQQEFAVPVGLIVVRNMSVSGQWSADAAAALASSSASLGPLALSGASSSSSADGSTTYSRPGMQVVAVQRATLPMLPPIDDPSLAAAAAGRSA